MSKYFYLCIFKTNDSLKFEKRKWILLVTNKLILSYKTLDSRKLLTPVIDIFLALLFVIDTIDRKNHSVTNYRISREVYIYK